MPGPQPRILTDQEREEVETLAAVLSTEQLADYFRMGRTTFFQMMKRDPDIAARYKRGKARAIGVVAKGLLDKARKGHTASAIFYLKTQAGWKETERVEHSGLNGTPIAVTATFDVTKLSDAAINELLEARVLPSPDDEDQNDGDGPAMGVTSQPAADADEA